MSKKHREMKAARKELQRSHMTPLHAAHAAQRKYDRERRAAAWSWKVKVRDETKS